MSARFCSDRRLDGPIGAGSRWAPPGDSERLTGRYSGICAGRVSICVRLVPPESGNRATQAVFASMDDIEDFLTGERQVLGIDRVLTTVLFTDIVASTNRAATLGDQRWRALLDAHDRTVRDQIRRFRGREITTTGDGFLVSFDGPARAIHCAQAMIKAAQRVGVELRVGLHTGECEVRGDDLAGLAIHIAARVGALAGPGEVLVSGTVKDLVVGSGIEFVERGEQELKGVPGTWKLFAVQS